MVLDFKSKAFGYTGPKGEAGTCLLLPFDPDTDLSVTAIPVFAIYPDLAHPGSFVAHVENATRGEPGDYGTFFDIEAHEQVGVVRIP